MHGHLAQRKIKAHPNKSYAYSLHTFGMVKPSFRPVAFLKIFLAIPCVRQTRLLQNTSGAPSPLATKTTSAAAGEVGAAVAFVELLFQGACASTEQQEHVCKDVSSMSKSAPPQPEKAKNDV